MATKSRPATQADLLTFFGRLPDCSVRARVLEQGGEIVGVAGYFMAGGRAVVFSDLKGDVPNMTIWREAKALMDSLRVPALCIAENGSGPFLERLGWQYVGPSADGEVYEWQHC